MDEVKTTRVALLTMLSVDTLFFAAMASPSHSDEEEIPWVELLDAESLRDAALRAGALICAEGLDLGTILLDEETPDYRLVIFSASIDGARPFAWADTDRVRRGSFGSFLKIAERRLSFPIYVAVLVPDMKRPDVYAAVCPSPNRPWSIARGPISSTDRTPHEAATRHAAFALGARTVVCAALFDRVILEGDTGFPQRLIVYVGVVDDGVELRAPGSGVAAWVSADFLRTDVWIGRHLDQILVGWREAQTAVRR